MPSVEQKLKNIHRDSDLKKNLLKGAGVGNWVEAC